jgi:UDP-glucose 4-epimerase
MITGSQQMRVRDLMVMIKEMTGNKIELEFLPTDSELHYQVTPYSFHPKIAKKYVSPYYHDIGQGILDILSDIYQKNFPYKKQNGLYFKE